MAPSRARMNEEPLCQQVDAPYYQGGFYPSQTLSIFYPPNNVSRHKRVIA